MWTKLKLVFWQWAGLWITIPSITGLIILLRLSGLLQFWEWAAFDQYMRWRPKELRDDRIAIVGIDETDLEQLVKQDYLPDELLAQLLIELKARQPRAIGLDIYRHLPVEPGHQKLVKIFESTL